MPLGVEGGSPALISGEMSEEALLKLRRVAAQWEALEGAAGTLRGERPGSRGYAEAAARLDAAGERVLVSMDGVVKAISAQAEWEAAALKILQFVLAALFLSIGSLAYRYIVTADRLREAMRRMVADEKFAAIGKMSGMVAHELRNPLAAADSSCYIIERIAQADERVAAHVDRIRKAISKCTDVIESMRRLGKLDPLRLEEVEIEWLFEEALRMVETGGLVEVEIDVDPGMRVSVDASHFIIALRNVKANAVQAMPEGGALKLGAKRLEGKVVISVEDSGVGLHDHQLEKMFDPLYSTKENGFGLGLSIVKMIVDMHGGEINVQSRRGSGTAFNIAIPA